MDGLPSPIKLAPRYQLRHYLPGFDLTALFGQKGSEIQDNNSPETTADVSDQGQEGPGQDRDDQDNADGHQDAPEVSSPRWRDVEMSDAGNNPPQLAANLEAMESLKLEVQQLRQEGRQRDVKIQQQDIKIQQKDIKIQEQDVKIQQQDTKIQQQDSKIQQQDVRIQQQDSETQRLRAPPPDFQAIKTNIESLQISLERIEAANDVQRNEMASLHGGGGMPSGNSSQRNLDLPRWHSDGL
ncbi:hypothetical protein QBC34DRAFT_438887 [Podospora aff. communis PSN243]|uniref:Uncharacterized protein n=1 Tax=Podospora aff. communis PSN243 TaxID=3040156 RepID=A0AAV9GJ38_9PEZI|nr:hypothetical protein QBC34DRAFT_438887 [Podospora aff. communis PSN243]